MISIWKLNLDKAKIKSFFTKENLQELIHKFKTEKKYVFYLILFWIGFELFIITIFWIILWANNRTLEQKSDKLLMLTSYKIATTEFKNIVNANVLSWEVKDFVNEYVTVKNEKTRIDNQFKKLQAPFTYFLRYKYLPALNIWQDPFTKQIDMDIMWDVFLKTNPYVDTNMINKWSDFFRNLWDWVSYNEITNILIWNMSVKDDYFVNPITVSFQAPDRRTFLMLINKLSMTSNKKNISMVNEFTYNLWMSIKQANAWFFGSWALAKDVKAWELVDEFVWEMFYRTIVESKKLNELSERQGYYVFGLENNWKNYTIWLSKEVLDSKISALNNISQFDYKQFQNISHMWTWFDKISWDWWLVARVIDKNSQTDIKIDDEVFIRKLLFFNSSKLFLATSDGKVVYLKYDLKENKIKIHYAFDTLFVKFVNEDVINNAIKLSAGCDDGEDKKSCYFKFRDKFRDISNLAYNIWSESTDRVAKLLTFYRWVPPIINVDRFVFREWDSKSQSQNNAKFEWDVGISIYWKNIPDEDVVNIEKALWEKCFGDASKPLNPGQVESVIKAEFAKVSIDKNVDAKELASFNEMQTIIQDLNKSYVNLDNYNKIIKLFEVYRIISENEKQICTQ